jgi:hypothetical protein
MRILGQAFRIVVFAILALIGGALGGVVGYEFARRMLIPEPGYVSAPEYATWKHAMQAICAIGIAGGAATLTAMGNVAMRLASRTITAIATAIRKRSERPAL